MLNIAKTNFNTLKGCYSKGDNVPEEELDGYRDMVDVYPDDYFEKKLAAEKYLKEFDPEVKEVKQTAENNEATDEAVIEKETMPEGNKVMTKKDLKTKK